MTNFNDSEVYLFEDSLYLLTEKPVTWGEAQIEAQGLGGTLAAINNEREQIFLSGLFVGQRSWIGLSDAASEGNFTWTTGEPVNFKKWNPRRPINNTTANFAAMLGGGNWYDFGGTQKYEGIVETSITELDVNNPLNTPVYRFYNTQAGGHFFTSSPEERDFVINNLPQYNYEGIGFEAGFA